MCFTEGAFYGKHIFLWQIFDKFKGFFHILLKKKFEHSQMKNLM